MKFKRLCLETIDHHAESSFGNSGNHFYRNRLEAARKIISNGETGANDLVISTTDILYSARILISYMSSSVEVYGLCN